MSEGGASTGSPGTVSGDPALLKTGSERALEAIVALVLVVGAGVTFGFANQPLLEAHTFRQTHTALTAYWLVQNGFSLAYETPVAGVPWSIPFEAPIYEGIVAGVSSLTGAPLSATGRVLSWLFLVAGIAPSLAIGRRLRVPRQVSLAFVALWLSSPLYLFWGRAFLIETTVMFFVVSALPFGIDVVRGTAGPKQAAIGGALFTLAMLQKPTAAAPPLLVVGICWLVSEVRRVFVSRRLEVRLFVVPMLQFSWPLAAALSWTHFADGLKKLNAFGSRITSETLMGWHFGDLAQRTSLRLYEEVLWGRLARDNAGGLPGAALILAALFVPRAAHFRKPLLLALLLFVLPTFIFTNLHLVHTYYQIECGLFGAAALSIAVAGFLPEVIAHPFVVPLSTLVFVGINLARFHAAHWAEVTARFPVQGTRTLAVAEALKRYTAPDSAFVAFGFEWSSELAYYAERKSFTVPDFFFGHKVAWRQPERYLGPSSLGAIVVCPSAAGPSSDDVLRRYWTERTWSYVTIQGCQLLIPTGK